MKSRLMSKFMVISLALIIFCCGGSDPYQKAKRINTIDAYLQFIQENPQSEFIEVAKIKIDSLRFEKLALKDSTQLYEDFLTKYPDSNFRSRVETKLESLKYQNACYENTIQAYEAYLINYPHGKFRSQINDKLEHRIYQNACSLNTIQSYKNYLQNYPNGNHSELVRSNIQKLIEKENEIIFSGIVVDQNDLPVKEKTFVLGIYLDGDMGFVIGEGGKIGNPRTNSDSMGRFKIKTSKDVIKGYCKNDRKLTIGCSKSETLNNLKIPLLKKGEETIIISFDQISSKMDLGKLSVNIY